VYVAKVMFKITDVFQSLEEDSWTMVYDMSKIVHYLSYKCLLIELYNWIFTDYKIGRNFVNFFLGLYNMPKSYKEIELQANTSSDLVETRVGL